MKYEVRFIIDGNEQREIVDVATAAEAAETVQQGQSEHGTGFELIQVQLLDDPSASNESQETESVEHAS